MVLDRKPPPSDIRVGVERVVHSVSSSSFSIHVPASSVTDIPLKRSSVAVQPDAPEPSEVASGSCLPVRENVNEPSAKAAKCDVELPKVTDSVVAETVSPPPAPFQDPAVDDEKIFNLERDGE